MQVLYLGRAPRTKETLPDFCEKCRVTRHSRVFRGLTGSQRTPGNWGVTRCEASEAESSIECLTYECHALRGDFQRQEALVIQRDGAIASLRDEAYTQWASGWLAFQRRVANAYLGLDLNFDIPSDEEAEESFSTNCSRETAAPAEARSPSSPSAPNLAPDV